MKNLIKANKDANYKIQEGDQGFVHVELFRRTIIPGQEKDPSEFSYVQQYDVRTFERDFNTGDEKKNRDNLNAMNVHHIKILHDPRIKTPASSTGDAPEAKTNEKVKSPAQIKREETIARNKAAKEKAAGK